MSRGKKKSKKRSNVDPGRKICDDGARSDLRKNEVPARTEAVLLAATVDELARIAADLHLAAKAQAYKHPMVLVMDEGASARDPLIGVVTSISQASLQFRLHRCRTRLIGLHPPRGVGGAASVSPLLYWLIAEGQFFVRVLQMEEQYRALLETIKDKGTEDVLVCSYVAREKVMTITYLLSDVLEWEPCLGLEDVMVLKERTGEVKSYFDTGEAGPRPAGQSSAMVPAPAPSSADGTCASCGVRAVRFMYYPAPVSCYVSFDRASSVSAATDKDSGDVFVSFQAGGVVRPDIVAQVGDLHCYWRGEPPPNFTPVGFCQRACATRYAEQRGVLLITDSRVITPQSSAFDAFAKSHKLTKSLSINREDDWQTEYQELTALLESPPCLPDHLITLCGLVYQKGHKSLAERAIDSILARFPLHKVIDRLIPVLAQMGQVSRIDELYEQMLLMRDRHEDLGWQRLTNWAFAIVGHRPAKAKVLSKIALALSGQDSLVVCNHLNVLQVNGSLDEAVSFLEGHAHLLRTHAGNFAAGQVYLKAERPAEALDHLLVAKEALDEPLTERYLAEAYLALGRLPEAQAAISAALACLESYRGETYDDPSGHLITEAGFSYEERKFLRKCLLILEGKLLAELGEATPARERMRDALAITTDSQDGLFKQATELLSGTAAPTESTAPGEAAQRAPRDQPELDRIRAKLQTYESYLEALGQIDSAWRVFNSHIRTTAESESARGVIVDRIHALTVLLRNARDDRYRETYQGLRCEFAHLPGKAIEFLANARYLMEEVGRSAESQPIFSGVIVELAKAAEYCCKEMLLRAFAAQLLHENVRSYDIQCPGVGGSTRRVRLLASGKQLYISLGDVAAILRSSEQRLEEFLKTYLGNHRSWVTGILPGVLSVVKDSFRNPSAHNTSATRQEAEKLYDYLRQEQFFEEMDRAGAHLAGLY